MHFYMGRLDVEMVGIKGEIRLHKWSKNIFVCFGAAEECTSNSQPTRVCGAHGRFFSTWFLEVEEHRNSPLAISGLPHRTSDGGACPRSGSRENHVSRDILRGGPGRCYTRHLGQRQRVVRHCWNI